MAIEKEYVYSSYMYNNFDPMKFDQRIRGMEIMVDNCDVDQFDCIACRGVSGLMIAAPLAFLMEKALIVVRKSVESTHSDRKIEGYLPQDLRYIIVDDFVDSGDTIRAIITQIADFYKEEKRRHKKSTHGRQSAECVGAFFYSRYCTDGMPAKNKKFFQRHIHGPKLSWQA